MTITLITGANKGLGFETARRLTDAGHTVPHTRASTSRFTGTDFNNHRGTQSVADGTDAIVRLATLPPDGPTGTFQDRNGMVPW